MTVLGRVLEINFEDEVKYDNISFDDIEDVPNWALRYVQIMVNDGYISGYDDNTLRPNNNISRGETATIISNMFIG